MHELIRTFTVRWPGEAEHITRRRIQDELLRLATERWGFLGYRLVGSDIRRAPDSGELTTLARQVRTDVQFGNPNFVFPADAEVWEGWAEFEEANRWAVAEEGVDRWTV